MEKTLKTTEEIQNEAIAHGWQRVSGTIWDRASSRLPHLPLYLQVHIVSPDKDGYYIHLRAKLFGCFETAFITRFSDFDDLNKHCERHGHDTCDFVYKGPLD